VFLLSDVVSRFSFKCPPNIQSSECGTNCGVMMDEDGDLIVCRKPNSIQKEGVIAIGKVLHIYIYIYIYIYIHTSIKF
jgi:hypothetical protein